MPKEEIIGKNQWHDMNWFRENFGPKLITVDEAKGFSPYDWNSLRHALLKGKLKTKKKEKKMIWFPKLRKMVNKLKEDLEDYRKEYQEIDREIYQESPAPGLVSRIQKLETFETVDCHTCGCVVRKEIAFRGHDRIERIVYHRNRGGLGDLVERATEKTRETWYCKLHAKGKRRYGSHLGIKDK